MKKIQNLFKRKHNEAGQFLVYDEVLPGSEWVLRGEGVATIKYDGTAVMFRDSILYKRYDRKMNKRAYKKLKSDSGFVPTVSDYKPKPNNWEPCEQEPNHATGHWPGWVPVGDEPENKWHRAALENYGAQPDGTYELVGKKINGNPYALQNHCFWKHGDLWTVKNTDRDYKSIFVYLRANNVEGIVFHHPDGRMAKIRRRDFGLSWPIK